MARPRVIDEGDGLQTLRFAASILYWRRTWHRVVLQLGVGRVATTTSPLSCYEILHSDSESSSCERSNEPSI